MLKVMPHRDNAHSPQRALHSPRLLPAASLTTVPVSHLTTRRSTRREEHMSRNKPFGRGPGPRLHGAPPHGAPIPAPHRYGSSSEELFGRVPFSPTPPPRYFGTGVAGYTSGPGFTGGYYGFGDEPPPVPTELEREYLHDVYGMEWGRPTESSAPSPPHFPPLRRYPPGPKGYRRSDERIREDLCDRLMRARHIDSSEVTVEVSGGKVLLEGTVPDRRMKHAIEDIAAACLGVEDIDNRIRVGAPEAVG
jgi:hypothetical protein